MGVVRILVTGGAGFIGSHTVLCLVAGGHDVLVVDNLSNSSEESLRRIRELVPDAALGFERLDLLDEPALEQVMARYRPEAVIHFAGLKAVGESTEFPLRYHHNNVGGTISLLQAMRRNDCRTLVFSSSATVYGGSATPPHAEDAPLATTNPYGRTKLHIEEMLRDVCDGPGDLAVASLRYFNPVGAHESGRIGESPTGIPNNLFPFVAQVAAGVRPCVRVFGNDYPTPDGTGVRDYIHVMDLADGHLKALDQVHGTPGFQVWNLGTGHGSSVLEVVHAFERAAGREIAVEFAARRPGDVAASFADPARATAELGWQATRDLNNMCADHWRWQRRNPRGFEA